MFKIQTAEKMEGPWTDHNSETYTKAKAAKVIAEDILKKPPEEQPAFIRVFNEDSTTGRATHILIGRKKSSGAAS